MIFISLSKGFVILQVVSIPMLSLILSHLRRLPKTRRGRGGQKKDGRQDGRPKKGGERQDPREDGGLAEGRPSI